MRSAVRGHHQQPRAPLPGDATVQLVRAARSRRCMTRESVSRRAMAAACSPEVLAVTRRRTSTSPSLRKCRSSRRWSFSHTLQLTEMQRDDRRPRSSRRSWTASAFLQSVGLEYLTLSRSSGTLSGGESQRIRLATQIGSSLMGVLYILDEPSIGLHQRDNEKLLATLKQPARPGQHAYRRRARRGHHVWRRTISSTSARARASTAARSSPQGTLDEMINEPDDPITGQYLSGRKNDPGSEDTPRRATENALRSRARRQNNLKNIDVADSRSGMFTCVTGVSGSGQVLASSTRSSTSALARGAERRDNGMPGKRRRNRGHGKSRQGHRHRPVAHRTHAALQPGDLYGRVQRYPRAVRQDAGREGARLRRRDASPSTSRAAAARPARATACSKIEMHFLPDVYVPCEVCKRQALQPRDARGASTRARISTTCWI